MQAKEACADSDLILGMTMNMDWEALYQEYHAAEKAREQQRRDQVLRRARTALQNRRLQNVDWLTAALEDETRKWFVARAMASGMQMPERLFTPMIRAAISQPDPSSPKWFVEPCLRCFGPRRVNAILLDLLEGGTDTEKIGASSALYFAMGMVGRDGIADEDIEDLRVRKRCLALFIFVANENVHLRRCLLAGLPLKEALYPAELRPLVPEAIRIARGHPDEYIRHRVEVQLGSGRPYKPLPTVPN